VVIQCFILFGCLAAGELIVGVTGIRLPASIVGMLLLALLLALKVVKLQQIEKLTSFLISNLGFFFVPPGVALMVHLGLIRSEIVPIAVATLVSTALVLWFTAWTHIVASRGERKVKDRLSRRSGRKEVADA
jgi:holin-like protein